MIVVERRVDVVRKVLARCRAIDETACRSGEAVLVQLALEERCTKAEHRREIAELAAIFTRNLVQDRVGQAVALVDLVAVHVEQRGIDREHIDRLAIGQHRADLAGLAVACAVPGVSDANAVIVVDVVDQVGDNAVAVGTRLAGIVARDFVVEVAVAVEVATEVVPAVESAGVGTAVDREEGFTKIVGAAAIGFDVLVARVEGEGQRIGDAEARSTADITRVGRVVTAIECRAATVAVIIVHRLSGAPDTACDNARIDGAGEFAIVFVDREAAVFGTGCEQRFKAFRTGEVVAVDVPVTRHSDEIAIRTQVLPDAPVELRLVDPAVRIVGHAVGGVARRNEGLGADAGDVAGIDHAERAAVERVTRAGSEHFADRQVADEADVVARFTRADVDRAAGGRSSRAVDVGGAEIDADRFEDFGVDLLVGVECVVTRIVERQAVERLRDAVGTEAADGETATRRTPRVVVLEADTGNQVDNVVDRLAGTLAADDLFAENLLRLGGVGIFDAADAGFAGTGNDDDRIVEIDRTGGLCGGRGGDHGAGGADHRRGQEIFELHRADPFVSLKVG